MQRDKLESSTERQKEEKDRQTCLERRKEPEKSGEGILQKQTTDEEKTPEDTEISLEFSPKTKKSPDQTSKAGGLFPPGRPTACCLTIVRHVAISSLQHQVDAVAPPADLLHRLAVGHPGGAVPVDLHQLVADLRTRKHTAA